MEHSHQHIDEHFISPRETVYISIICGTAILVFSFVLVVYGFYMRKLLEREMFHTTQISPVMNWEGSIKSSITASGINKTIAPGGPFYRIVHRLGCNYNPIEALIKPIALYDLPFEYCTDFVYDRLAWESNVTPIFISSKHKNIHLSIYGYEELVRLVGSQSSVMKTGFPRFYTGWLESDRTLNDDFVEEILNENVKNKLIHFLANYPPFTNLAIFASRAVSVRAAKWFSDFAISLKQSLNHVLLCFTRYELIAPNNQLLYKNNVVVIHLKGKIPKNMTCNAKCGKSPSIEDTVKKSYAVTDRTAATRNILIGFSVAATELSANGLLSISIDDFCHLGKDKNKTYHACCESFTLNEKTYYRVHDLSKAFSNFPTYLGFYLTHIQWDNLKKCQGQKKFSTIRMVKKVLRNRTLIEK